MQPLSDNMIAFLEGIIHQETFEKGGFVYEMKTFTSHEKADSYISKNPEFSVMEERNGYIYVGTKTQTEMPKNINESYTGEAIYEAALKNGMSEEEAREFILSLEA